MELKSKGKRKIFPQHMINQQIPFAEILLVGDGSEQVNEIISKEKALKKAQQEQKDLVCFRLPNPDKQTLATCKIIDYRKYLYELGKKSKVKKTVLKKIELAYRIGEQDEKTKIEKTKKWLESNYQVKISLKMVNQKEEHKELALEKCKKIITDLQSQDEGIKLQGKIKSQGRVYSFLLQKNK
jgi:translation initiation factor IF-3